MNVVAKTKISNESSYEFFCVLSCSKISEEEQEGIIAKFETLIKEHGQLGNIDRWGKRRLAYPIKKEVEGNYVLFEFKSKTDFPVELDRITRITDGVLRTLIVKKDVEKNKEAE